MWSSRSALETTNTICRSTVSIFSASIANTILMINSPVIKDKGTDTNWITVLACLPSDTTSPMVAPQCTLNATWPRGYGDIIWGEDNCLYEAGRTIIDDQCAEAIVPGDVSVVVKNPYYTPPQQPDPSPQPDPASQPDPAAQPDPFPACKSVDLSQLSCNKDCCGFIPCPDWCNANCGGRSC